MSGRNSRRCAFDFFNFDRCIMLIDASRYENFVHGKVAPASGVGNRATLK